MVTVKDVAEILPRALTDEEIQRMEKLVKQSLELIEMEFARHGRIFGTEVKTSVWLPVAVKQAVRRMVGAAILVGEDVGRASASSTTGPQSDSITWSQGIPIQWGGVDIDDGILELLGLISAAMPRGRGGKVIPFGKRRWLRGAEFAERRR